MNLAPACLPAWCLPACLPACLQVLLIAGGCADRTELGEANLGLEHRSLVDALGDADEIVLWSRTTTFEDDVEHTVEYLTPDASLVARFNEITTTGFFDPDVMVVDEASIHAGAEQAFPTYAVTLGLRRRSALEGDLRAALPVAERASRVARPSAEDRLDSEMRLGIAEGEELSELVVLLSAAPSTKIPPRPSSPLALTPLEKADLQLARLEAMAARGQEIVELQRSFVEWLESEGGQVISRPWLDNRIYVRARPRLMPAIAARPDVLRVTRTARMRAESPADRNVIRESIQAQDYLDAGYDGSRTSSRNDHGILVGIIEVGDQTDDDHDGLLDKGGGASRVVETWDCENHANPNDCDGTLDACSGGHGLRVASVAVADFLDDQDGSVTDEEEQGARSGIAQEAHMTLTTYSGDAGAISAIQKAIADGVDIVNHSAGDTDYTCNPNDSDATPINDAYEDGILWINSAGNSGAFCAADYSCRLNDQAAAYGSFAVAAHSSGGPLEDAAMCMGSYGHDTLMGDLTDLAAPGGVYYPMDCGNDYGSDTLECAGSSYAAPHVTGAAALLMDRWIAQFGDAQAHQPGRMRSALLMMADGCGDDGDDGVHGCWGAGRLRMRRFDDYGLDAPYKFKSERVFLTKSLSYYASYLNVVSGANQPLQSDVDAVVAVAWCRHLNMDDPGIISLGIYDNDTSTYAAASSEYGEKTRVMLDPTTHRYSVVLAVADVDWTPEGLMLDCYLTWLWEDSDRDDANGPDGTVEPFDITGSGTSCGDCCP